MSEEWRVFAAIDLTDEIRDRIRRTQELLESDGWKCRWVAEEKMHMTVRFFGNLAVPTVEQLREELRPRLAARPRFELRVSRVGAFPGPNRPRTLWLGVDDPFQQLGKLREAVDSGSEAAGIEREPGPYKPHLTVGRLRPEFKVDSDDAVEAFQRFGSYEPIFWVPETVRLIRSQFGRGGTTHTTLEEFELGPPDGTVSEGDEEPNRVVLPTLLDYLDDSDPPGEDNGAIPAMSVGDQANGRESSGIESDEEDETEGGTTT